MTDWALTIMLDGNRREFQPGETLSGDVRIDSPGFVPPKALELSVLWYTEGKGDEDLAVHFFDRRSTADGDVVDLRKPQRFATTLPNSPLSYDGVILKICWCVRARLFTDRGKELLAEVPFQLGRVPRPRGEFE